MAIIACSCSETEELEMAIDNKNQDSEYIKFEVKVKDNKTQTRSSLSNWQINESTGSTPIEFCLGEPAWNVYTFSCYYSSRDVFYTQKVFSASATEKYNDNDDGYKHFDVSVKKTDVENFSEGYCTMKFALNNSEIGLADGSYYYNVFDKQYPWRPSFGSYKFNEVGFNANKNLLMYASEYDFYSELEIGYEEFRFSDDTKIEVSNINSVFLVITDEFQDDIKNKNWHYFFSWFDYKTGRPINEVVTFDWRGNPLTFNDWSYSLLNMQTNEGCPVFGNKVSSNKYSAGWHHIVYDYYDKNIRSIVTSNHVETLQGSTINKLNDDRLFNYIAIRSVSMPFGLMNTDNEISNRNDEGGLVKYLNISMIDDGYELKDKELQRLVIDLSSLDIKPNNLYIIKNKRGTKFFSTETRSGNTNVIDEGCYEVEEFQL
ncbi:MAG: hypothetical protein NC095_03660 [Muribaculum sp.]|nr:hypothetical protein [Muribaculum sp.]